ncbi:MAG: hypothetical protein C0614_05285, partial [Desulfuromonas sp.]
MQEGIQFKVTKFLVIVLLVAFTITTFVSTLKTTSLLNDASRMSEKALHLAAEEQAHNVFSSLEIGTAGSLERGEMEVFKALLQDLGQIEGVEEIGLSDPSGKIVYSSQEKALQTQLLEEDYAAAIKKGGDIFKSERNSSLYLYRPHFMTTDCLRCHFKARIGDLAGVIYVQYSLEKLIQAIDDMAEFTDEATLQAMLVGGIVGFVGLFVSSIGIFFMLGLVVRKPIVELSERMSALAEGDADLTTQLETNSKDELGALAENFNRFVGNLRELVIRILTTVDKVTIGSKNILEASNTIRAGSTRQNEMTQSAATASEEMKVSVGEVVRSAQKAAENARVAADNALSGGEIVEGAMESMQQVALHTNNIAEKVQALSSHLRGIDQIMALINNISSQTKLIAFNASIEASAAGEWGQRFSVVATEVRKLSEETSRAIQEVRETVEAINLEAEESLNLIHSGLNEVTKSSRLSTEAGDSLRTIVEQICENAEMVSQIAAAATQQDSAVREITKGLETIANLT